MKNGEQVLNNENNFENIKYRQFNFDSITRFFGNGKLIPMNEFIAF